MPGWSTVGRAAGKLKSGETAENAQALLDPSDAKKQKQAAADLATDASCTVAEKWPSPLTVGTCSVAAANGWSVRNAGHPAQPGSQGPTIEEAVDAAKKTGGAVDGNDAKAADRALDTQVETRERPFTAGGKAVLNGVTDFIGNGVGAAVKAGRDFINGGDGVARMSDEDQKGIDKRVEEDKQKAKLGQDSSGATPVAADPVLAAPTPDATAGMDDAAKKEIAAASNPDGTSPEPAAEDKKKDDE